MNKLLALCFLFVLINTTSAQLSIGYFPIQSELSISTNTEQRIWGDLRIATNTFFGNITTEPILIVNIKKKEAVTYYCGFGIQTNFFNAAADLSIINGYNLHFGIRAKPITQLTNIHFIFEVSPYMNRYFDGGILRTRIGLAYQFSKSSKTSSI